VLQAQDDNLANKPFFACADPAPGSAELFDAALADAPVAALATPSPAPVDTGLPGYRAGQRIPYGLRSGGAIAPAGAFALPIDSFTSYCTRGGLPVGFGFDHPAPASVRRRVCADNASAATRELALAAA
jgi:hypothetical protein